MVSLQTRQRLQVDAAVLRSHFFGTQAHFWKKKNKDIRYKWYKSTINLLFSVVLIYIKQWYVETDMNVSQSLTQTLALTPDIQWYNYITYDKAIFSMTNSRQRRSNI